jgi:mannosyltransferase
MGMVRPIASLGHVSARLPTTRPPHSPASPRHVDPAIVGLTILGFAVASYRLGTKSMWLDEAVSANHARLGLSQLWTVISDRDPNMGLYYVLLHFWVRVFGSGETAVRSMTVVLAGLAAPTTALLGKRLFGRAAGLTAGVLLALGPFFVQYEQTARSYALVVLLVTLSSYCFVTALEQPSRRSFVGYALASTLAIYTHYFAAYVLLVQLLTLLAVKRRAALAPAWLASWGAIVLLCAPEAVFALRAGTGNISWIVAPSLHSLVHLPSDLAGSSSLALLLLMLAGYGFVRAVADRQGWQAAFLAAWLVVPVVLDFAVSRLGHPLFVSYYLIVVLPALLLLAALGVTRLPWRASRAIVLGLLVVLSAVGIRDWYTHPDLENYRGATRYLLSNEHSGDGIVYYPAGTLAGPTSGIAYYEALAGEKGPTSVRFQLERGPLVHPPRIWLVMRDSDVPVLQRDRVERSVSRSYEQVGAPGVFQNITVVLYRAKATRGAARSRLLARQPWHSTATSSAAHTSRMRSSLSRPRRSTRTATDTLSTESRLIDDRWGIGSSSGSRTTSLAKLRMVVVHGATSARLKRGIAASRESTTTGRRPISGNSHHHSSPLAGRGAPLTMLRPPRGTTPDRPTRRAP